MLLQYQFNNLSNVMYRNYKKNYYLAWNKGVNIHATKYVYVIQEMLYLFIQFIDIFYIIFHAKIDTPGSNTALLTVIQLKAKYFSNKKYKRN
jgi:hypothetical protein